MKRLVSLLADGLPLYVLAAVGIACYALWLNRTPLITDAAAVATYLPYNAVSAYRHMTGTHTPLTHVTFGVKGPRLSGLHKGALGQLTPWPAWWAHRATRVHQLTAAPQAAFNKTVWWATAIEGLVLLLLLGRVKAHRLLPRLWHPFVFYIWKRPRRLRPSTVHGRARWMRWYEKAWLCLYRPRLWGWWRPKAPVFVLGKYGRLPWQWLNAPAFLQGVNILVVGRPTVGKTRRIIVQNLARETGMRSLIVLDAKGTLNRKLRRYLESAGFEVQVVDFVGAVQSGWNPCAHFTGAAEVMNFVEVWIANTGISQNTPFWDNTIRLLMGASILHLNKVSRERSGEPTTLIKVERFMSRCANPRQLKAVVAELKDSGGVVAEMAGQFIASLQENTELAGSVGTGVPLRFLQLLDDRTRQMLARNDVDFRAMADPKQKPVALFLVIRPGKTKNLKALTASFMTQMMDTLMEYAEECGGTLPRPVIQYLDEIGNVGRLADLDERMNTTREAGIYSVLALQEITQLQAIYPETWKQILYACQTWCAFAGMGHEDAKVFCEELGHRTVAQRQAQRGRERKHLLAGQAGASETEVGVPLITPDDLKNLKRGRLLVDLNFHRPVIVRTIDYARTWALRGRVTESKEVEAMERAESADAALALPELLVKPSESRPDTPGQTEAFEPVREWAEPGCPILPLDLEPVDWS